MAEAAAAKEAAEAAAAHIDSLERACRTFDAREQELKQELEALRDEARADKSAAAEARAEAEALKGELAGLAQRIKMRKDAAKEAAEAAEREAAKAVETAGGPHWQSSSRARSCGCADRRGGNPSTSGGSRSRVGRGQGSA